MKSSQVLVHSQKQASHSKSVDILQQTCYKKPISGWGHIWLVTACWWQVCCKCLKVVHPCWCQGLYAPWKSWKPWISILVLKNPGILNLFLENPGKLRNWAGYSWVSRDVIILLGVNSKSMHSDLREIVFHCMCWPCVWQQMCAISWDFFTPVQHNHQYILGWPPLRLTAKYPSETQE